MSTSRLGVTARATGCFLAALLALTATACSDAAVSGEQGEPSDSGIPPAQAELAFGDVGSVDPARLAESARALEVVEAVRRRFAVRPLEAPAVDGRVPARPRSGPAPALAQASATGFVAVPGGVRPMVRAIPSGSGVRQAIVTLPEHGDGAVSVEDRTSGVAMAFVLEGAASGRIEVAGGYALYAGAGPEGAHVIHRPHPEGTEDHVVFEARPTREELVYTVDVSRAAGVRLVSETFELLDPGGTPRLRMAPPYLVDAVGARIDARVSVEGCRYDTDPRAPWGRPVTPAGARACTVRVSWEGVDARYPLVVDPAWATTGSMAVLRASHAATALASGSVLVTGGATTGSTPNSSAELYDGIGSFAATGAMAAARYWHTATLLPSGAVLVAGGLGSAALASAERYESTGTFVAAGSMSTGRWQHTATLLPSGRALIAGGQASAGTVASADTYDETLGFAPTGAMTTPRRGHTATLLASGRVLVAGGQSTVVHASAEVYDGVSAFVATASMATPRHGHVASLLGDGRVLVAGGHDGTAYLATAEHFDGTSAFSPTGAMATPRAYMAAARLPAGGVLVAGGYNTTSATTSASEVFDPTANAFTTRLSMVYPRMDAAATLLDSGAVLLSGGRIGPDYLAAAELYFNEPAGAACTVAGRCASGFCVDGVCCAEACTGRCQACSAAKKASGADGVCGLIPDGVDPDSECTTMGTGVCTGDGVCNGGGVCRSSLRGGTCNPSACASSSIQTNASTCDGNGVCQTNGSTSCAPYLCSSTACTSSCVTSVDCAPGIACVAGVCVAALSNGTACTADAQCLSSFCVQGVCCDAACDSPCTSCLALDKADGSASGNCGAVRSDTDPKDACPADTDPCGADGLCDAGGLCRSVARAGKTCGAAACNASLTAVTGRVCDGAGLCVDSTTPVSCSPYRCAGGSCLQSCGASTDCANGLVCVGGACVSPLQKGQACSAGGQCQSGFCVDSVCCDSLCDGACVSCLAAYKVAGSTGDCGPVRADIDPKDGCSPGAGACAADGLCDGNGACRATARAGTSCGATTCTGPTTVAGATCDAGGACVTAAGTDCGAYACRSGACVASCAVAADCAPGHYCAAGACFAARSNGSPCAAPGECTSGFCREGVCCDQLCDGKCESCLGSVKASGSSGACGPVAAGTLKSTSAADACPTGADTCGAPGACDGQGSCALHADPGVPCAADTCAASSVARWRCDGQGTCASTPASCEPFTCRSGACLATCASTADCASGYRCDAGGCVPRTAQGGACAADADCATGHCADGVCCDSPCGTFQCAACNLPGSVGRCMPVVGDPLSPRAPCGGAGACRGQCDGANVTACLFPDIATPCSVARCDDDAFVPASTCDGSGQCAAATPEDCGDYACGSVTGGGFACKTRCTSSADCKGGAVCDVGSGTCSAAGATCEGGFSVRATDGTVTYCNGHRCVQGSGCQQTCAAPADCDTAASYGCEGGVCRRGDAGSGGAGGTAGAAGASGASAADDGGCGCAVPETSSPLRWWTVVGSAMLALQRRRPRRRPAAR